MIDQVSAQFLLLKCNGDEIWDLETCRKEGVPQPWLDELVDCHESGFDNDLNSIYVDGKLVNQYHGVPDVKLACKLAEFLGIDWQRLASFSPGRTELVSAIKAEIDEL